MRYQSVFRALLLSGAAAIGLGFGPAASQPAAPPVNCDDPQVASANPDQCASGEEEVVVTGTRIRKPEFESVYPSSSVSSEEMDNRGITNVLDALNTLPSTGIGATPVGTQASQGVGGAFVNLFDLGTQRTLTLVNGRRFVGGNESTLFGQANSGLQVDLNVIPTALIDRIEVVSVGGAPVYGADAIAGTVNVILKRNFEGTEVDAQYGEYQGGFGQAWRIRGTEGVNFDEGKGNATITFERNKTDGFTNQVSPYLSRQYAFVANPFNSAPFNTNPEPNGVFDNYLIADRRLPSLTSGGAIFRTGTAPTYLTAAGRSYLIANPTVAANNPAFALVNTTTSPLLTRLASAAEIAAGARAPEGGVGAPRVAVPLLFNADSTIRGMDVGVIAADQVLTNQLAIGGDGLNLAPLTSLQTFLDRKLITFTGNYEFDPGFRVYAEAFYAKIEGVEPANQAGFNSSLFGAPSSALGFRTDNPFLPAQARAVLNDPNLNLDPTAAASFRWTSLSAIGPWGGCAPNLAGVPAALITACTAPAGTRQFFTSRDYEDIVGFGESKTTAETSRFVVGAEGDFQIFGFDWSYDTSVTYGRSYALNRNVSILQAQFNAARDAIASGTDILCRVNSANALENQSARFGFRYTNVAPAAGSVEIDPTSPAPPAGFFRRVVGDPLGITEASLNACRPINLFGNGASSPQSRDYVTGPIITSNTNEQTVFELNLAGSVFNLPAGEIQVAFGGSYRQEKTNFIAENDVAQYGLARSVAFASLRDAKYDSTEYYAEVQIPLLGEGFSLWGSDELTINGAYRYIDNSIAGKDEAWTYGFVYSPVQWLTFRGDKTKSVRAPSLTELFLPSSDSFSTAADPCDSTLINGGAVPAIRKANCEAQAAALGFTGLATFISDVRFATVRGVNAGNSTLTPEVAESETIGAIVQTDDVLGHMAIAVDYVKINLTNSIENFGLLALMQSCYDNPTFPTASCGRFVRNPGAGALPFQIKLGGAGDPAFQAGFINAGYRNFEGITGTFEWSFGLNEFGEKLGLYNSDADLGELSFRLVYSYVDLLEISVLGTGTDLDLADGEISRPYNESQLTTTYENGSLTWVLVWAHQGSAKFDQQFSAENRAQTTVDSYDLFNTSLIWDFTDNFSGRLIVNNVFDSLPPFPSGSIAYDQVGRFYQVGFKVKF